MSNRPPKYESGFTKPDPRTRFAFLLEAWSIYDRRPAEPPVDWRYLVEPVVKELTPAQRSLLFAGDADALDLVRRRVRERRGAGGHVNATVFDVRSLETSGGKAGVYNRAFAARVVYAAHIGLCGGSSFTATADALREVSGGHANKESLTRNHVRQAVRSHLAREKSACAAAGLPSEWVFLRSTADLRIVVALDGVRMWAEKAALLAFGPGHPRGAALARELDTLMGVAAQVDRFFTYRDAVLAHDKDIDPQVTESACRHIDGIFSEMRRLGLDANALRRLGYGDDAAA